MSDKDFDDFFEVDADGSVAKEKTEQLETPKPAAPAASKEGVTPALETSTPPLIPIAAIK